MSLTQTKDAAALPGEVTIAGDDMQVVFHRHYAKPIDKVWAAVTTPERLADAEIEMKVGGAIRLNWNKGANTMEGRVVVLDAPNAFAWTWPLGGRDTVVRFDLKADADGCWLTLTHSGISAHASGNSGGVRAGWHAHMEGIPDAMEGRATTWATKTERQEAFGPLYPPLPA